LPFRFQEVFKLTNLGLDPSLFKFGNLTFESQKYICVKDQASVHVIDTSQGFKVDKRDMKADSILMHKEKNIIAVRAAQGNATVIQVFDMDATKKITQVQIADTAIFWRWIGTGKLAVVG
jgi:clathrin heavy chain